jgi:hypothetical protein
MNILARAVSQLFGFAEKKHSGRRAGAPLTSPSVCRLNFTPTEPRPAKSAKP